MIYVLYLRRLVPDQHHHGPLILLRNGSEWKIRTPVLEAPSTSETASSP